MVRTFLLHRCGITGIPLKGPESLMLSSPQKPHPSPFPELRKEASKSARGQSPEQEFAKCTLLSSGEFPAGGHDAPATSSLPPMEKLHLDHFLKIRLPPKTPFRKLSFQKLQRNETKTLPKRLSVALPTEAVYGSGTDCWLGRAILLAEG